MITNAQLILDTVNMAMVCEYLGYDVSAQNRCACPVHQGTSKTSFRMSKSGYSGTCYSQCAGKNWKVVELLEELNPNLVYPQILELMAKIGRITVERKEYSPEENARYQEAKRHKEALSANLKLAYDIYPRPAGKVVTLPDGRGRSLSADTIAAFDIVISPNTNLVMKAAQEGRVDEDMLLELGVLRKSKAGRMYDPFANRIIFPIHDHLNKLVGLIGRVTKNNSSKTKYSNTEESPIFQKRKVLFGLKQNWKNIREFGAVLVESNMSVATMYDQHLRRAVASMGTAVTREQLQLLLRYTDQLTIIADAGPAGEKSATKTMEIAVELGFTVNLVTLPNPDNIDGYDPDDFLREDKDNAGQLQRMIDNAEDGIEILIRSHFRRVGDEFELKRGDDSLRSISDLLASIGNDYKKIKAEELLESILGKKEMKLVQIRVGKILKVREEEAKRPRYSDKEIEQIEKFQMYQRGNRLYACSRIEEKGFPFTNFVARPVMQVIGGNDSQVLLELTNIKGQRTTMEVNTDSMTEMGPFKKEILRRGFYVFDEQAKPHHFSRFISWLFDSMNRCHPLTVLGWNESQKFYAWANGLSLPDGSFKKINDYGIVKHGEHSFFLPAFSSVHISNPGDDSSNGYENMRDFVLDTNLQCPTVTKWSKLFGEVHGDNGKVGIAFYVTALFRSYIFDQMSIFPMLNLFGPPGLGKSYMAESIAAMFGKARDAFNLHDGTDVGLSRRIAQIKDGAAVCEEFNNNISPRRFQALKNFYDGAGREKGMKSQDNRTSTTPVNTAIVLVGQQQPTADVALFGRVISLNFGPRDLQPVDELLGDKLKAIEETACLSQITAHLITHRKAVKENFFKQYSTVKKDLGRDIPKGIARNVLSRLIKNNAIILTTFKIITEICEEDFSFTYSELRDIMHRIMVKQMFSINQEDDQATWWDMILNAIRTGDLKHERDFVVESTTSVPNVDVFTEAGKKKQTLEWGGKAKKLLFLHVPTAFTEYSLLLRRMGKDNGMPKSSIQHYLHGDKSFAGEKPKKLSGTTKRLSLFYIDNLPFDIQLTADWKSGNDGLPNDDSAPPFPMPKKVTDKPDPNGDDLPF